MGSLQSERQTLAAWTTSSAVTGRSRSCGGASGDARSAGDQESGAGTRIGGTNPLPSTVRVKPFAPPAYRWRDATKRMLEPERWRRWQTGIAWNSS